MSDPSERYSTFEDIADDLSHSNARSKDRILNLLLSDFWHDKFVSRNLGLDEYRVSLDLSDEPYNPDEPASWPSSEEGDIPRPSDFQPMSRKIAFSMLLSVEEPLAYDLSDDDCNPNFEWLARTKLACYGAKAQAILRNIAITNEGRRRFCDWHGFKIRNPYEVPSPRSLGRPTYKPEIEAAYKALRDAKEIDFDAPKNKLYEPIRKKVRAYKDDPSLEKGLQNEAIRKVIYPLFETDKSARPTSP